jgi:hypothetical protein
VLEKGFRIVETVESQEGRVGPLEPRRESENHPLVQWIAESKLAGLKETVKKDRPILNRQAYLHDF